MKRIETPWGQSQHQIEYAADGIVFHSTASHGGYHLSPQRQIELHEVEAFKPFGPEWLEEDCESAIVALRWAGHSTDEQIADAICMARCCASWSHSAARWQPVVDWLDTTMLHERAERHHEAVKHLWARGSMSTDGNGWSVDFRRGEERRTVHMDYPTKRYYSDEELAQLAVVDTATQPVDVDTTNGYAGAGHFDHHQD